MAPLRAVVGTYTLMRFGQAMERRCVLSPQRIEPGNPLGFEANYTHDQFWGLDDPGAANTRFLCTGYTFLVVGEAGPPTRSGACWDSSATSTSCWG